MKNQWLLFSAISGFFCVAFGAFTAHALENSLSASALVWIDKGLKYQMFHTLALLSLGLYQFAKISANLTACRVKMVNLIGGSWALGIIFFSGSLYALALGASKVFVWTTPVGGGLFLIGWAGLVFLCLRGKNDG